MTIHSRTTTETKAELRASSGRVIGIVKSTEPGKISLAVPGDRAVLTPSEARELAAWLNRQADTLAAGSTVAAARDTWRAAEARLRAEMRGECRDDRSW